MATAAEIRPNTEQRALRYRSLHFPTEIPKSLLENNQKKEFKVEDLEVNLHKQLLQHTERDDAGFQEVLHIFRAHSKQKLGANGQRQMMLTIDDFHQILGVLGVFATRTQAASLFMKYDRSGTGFLKMYDFITAVRPRDFGLEMPADKIAAAKKVSNSQRGKRMFRDTHLFGIPVRSVTPVTSDYTGLYAIYEGVRNKRRCRAGSGVTHSAPRARRGLLRLFENFDHSGTGTVPEPCLKRVLDRINYPLGSSNCQKVLDAHRTFDGMFDFTSFVRNIYPPHEDGIVCASLPSALELNKSYAGQQFAATQPGGGVPGGSGPLAQTYRPPASARNGRNGGFSSGAATYRAGGFSSRGVSRGGAFTMVGAQTSRGRPPLDWSTSHFVPNRRV